MDAVQRSMIQQILGDGEIEVQRARLEHHAHATQCFARLAVDVLDWAAATSPDKLEEMRDDLRCPPERMISVLDHLNRNWGGAEAYLEAAGLSSTAISRLRSKLADPIGR